jgi:hypothetical protein
MLKVWRMAIKMVYRVDGVTALTHATKKSGDDSKRDGQHY